MLNEVLQNTGIFTSIKYRILSVCFILHFYFLIFKFHFVAYLYGMYVWALKGCAEFTFMANGSQISALVMCLLLADEQQSLPNVGNTASSPF